MTDGAGRKRPQHLPAGRAVALFALAMLGGGCADEPVADAPKQTQADTTPDRAAPPGVPYQVAIEGVEDHALRTLLNEVSETWRLIDRPPPSLIRLRRRAEDDRANLQRALSSEGYYDAIIDVSVDPDAKPVRVLFQVHPGTRYRLRDVAIEVTPPDADPRLPSPQELGIAPGTPVVGQTVLDAEAKLLERATARGYALAELGERRALIDRNAGAIDLTLRLNTGPLVRFGEIKVAGLEEVQPDFVLRRLPWRPGELITSGRLAEGERALRDAELFSTIRTSLGKTPDAAERLPVTVTVNERKHRSFELGVRYSTDEGPGGNVAWEHRNFFGRGERVRAELDVSSITSALTGSFRKPDVWIRDLALLSAGALAFDNPDAYESKSATTSVGLERRFREGLTLAAGPAFRAEQIEEANSGRNESFGLVSLPVRFDWDRSDDRLDPTRGGRLSLGNEPFVDAFGNDLAFNKARLEYAHYFKVLEEPRVILAGRSAIGFLFGASRADVPADLRFYAGGGTSVRGFAFQTAGELDKENDPIGGRSLFEASGEVRVRLTETIGVVAFVNSGPAPGRGSATTVRSGRCASISDSR